MKTLFLRYVWLCFLELDKRLLLRRVLTSVDGYSEKLLTILQTLDLEKQEDIIDYLYLSAMLNISDIHHRRVTMFTFNPQNKIDLLFIIYVENRRDLQNLTYLQRIFLSNIAFKVKDKIVPAIAVEDGERAPSEYPIILEVSRV